AFVAKFDFSGTYLWARQYGTTQGASAVAVATDNLGDIFVTGGGGTIDFTTGAMTYTPGEGNMFLAKIDPGGNGLWSTHCATSSGGGTLEPSAMGVDGSGGLIVSVGLAGDSCCFAAGSADLGGGTLFSQAGGYGSGVLASYDSAGNY